MTNPELRVADNYQPPGVPGALNYAKFAAEMGRVSVLIALDIRDSILRQERLLQRAVDTAVPSSG